MELKFNIEDWIQRRWAWHAAYFLLFITVTFISFTHDTDLPYDTELKVASIEVLLNITASYISAWFLLPYFFQ